MALGTVYIVRTQPGGEGGSGHSYKLYYCTGGRGGQKRPKTCVRTMYTAPNDTTLDVVEEGGSGGSGKVFLRHGSSDHHHTNGNGKTPHNGNGNSNGNGPIGFGKDMVLAYIKQAYHLP